MLLLKCLWEAAWAPKVFDVIFFQLGNLSVGSGTLYFFFKQMLWLQDVSIREDIVILHQNHDLPIIRLTKNQDDKVIV